MDFRDRDGMIVRILLLLPVFASLACCVKSAKSAGEYRSWPYEKAVLVGPVSCQRVVPDYFDVLIRAQLADVDDPEASVRIFAKPGWDTLGEELPFQIHGVSKEGAGDSVSFRAVFQYMLPPCSTQRIGVLYGRKISAAPVFQTALQVRKEGGTYRVENTHYRVAVDEKTGALSSLVLKTDGGEAAYTSPGLLQEPVAVVFADSKPGKIEYASVHFEQGPLFFAVIREGPGVQVSCKFISGVPYFLVYSRIEFPAETKVFSVENNRLEVSEGVFTHYIFRPNTPSLPNTDIEEMGYVMVDTAYVHGLPDGLLLGDLLPPDLAWHGFINIDRKFSLISILLEDSAAGPVYRNGTYASREKGRLSCYHAPVRVHRRDAAANAVTIGAGSAYVRKSAIVFAEWDQEKWPKFIEGLGKQLNSQPEVRCFPETTPSPAPDAAGWPYGKQSSSYLKAGIR